jgi:membrane protein YdbS with pleckstrin-like domain
MSEPIVIKKTPVVIIKNLVLAEFILVTGYSVLGIFANYGEIYQGFLFSQTVSYEIAKLFLKLSVEAWVVGFIFLQWYFSAFIIYPNRVECERGIFFRRRKIFPLQRPVAVSYRYGLLSRIFQYGTLVIEQSASALPIVLREIPTPTSFGEAILAQNARLSSADSSPVLHERTGSQWINIDDVVKNREHEKLEFKNSLRWDGKVGRVNRNLEKSAFKTIAAFLNSDGGHLVIGVDDAGTVTGIEPDCRTLPRTDADGFENHFNNLFKEVFGAHLRRFVRLHFHAIDQKQICLVEVVPSVTPVYMKFDNTESFYIRTGNSTTALQMSEVSGYIKTRFRES